MSTSDPFLIAVIGIWVMLPAYIPNSAATLFGGGLPMDFGYSFQSGRRVLGDGKTWRGFFGGSLTGIMVGILQIIAIAPFDLDCGGFGRIPTAFSIVCTLAFGALLGDVLGAFIKRRLNIPQGAKAPGLDQYDFVIGAWALTAAFHFEWFYATFLHGIHIIALVTVIVVTPVLHRSVNIIGYKLGKKSVPW
jgi:CDP-2,3-bis-(O-geranylgeranyl)-sn-glycerol synthase